MAHIFDEIRKEASSQAIHRTVNECEEILEVPIEGETPSARRAKLIEILGQIKEQLAECQSDIDESNINDSLNQLIVEAFDNGVQKGFAKALQKFMNGSLKTRKIVNEYSWELHNTSSTPQYQITYKLPAVEGEQKTTVFIILNEHGFE